MEAKHRAQAIVLKRALLEQKEIVKSATMPTAKFIQTLQMTIFLAERPFKFVLDLLCKFLYALFENIDILELDIPRHIKMYILRNMNNMKDRAGMKGLDLFQDLAILLSGAVSLIELGLETGHGIKKVKRNLLYLILQSESFLEGIPEFYASAIDTERGMKRCDTVTTGINLLNYSILSAEQTPVFYPNEPILVERSTQSDGEVTKEEAKGGNVSEGRQDSLLYQYSKTIQLLTAKLSSP